MSSTETDSDSSHKRTKKRKKSSNRSHRSKNNRNISDSRSRERSLSKQSHHSRHKSSKKNYLKSRDLSSKYKSPIRRKTSKKSRMSRRSPQTSRHTSTNSSSVERKSKDEISKQKSDYEKIDTKEQIKKALQAAALVDDQLHHSNNIISKYGENDFIQQQQRAEQISEIDKGDFFQSDFKSSRNEIPLPKGSQIDASHASAMFGNYAWKDDVTKFKNKDDTLNDVINMMHPMLLESAEIKFERWKDKLFLMRKNFLKFNKGQLPWQIDK